MLSQAEADRQIAVPKWVMMEPFRGTSSFPDAIDFRPGVDLVYRAFSSDLRDSFYVDLARPSLKPQKLKLQLRASSMDILVRLDVHARHTRTPMVTGSAARTCTFIGKEPGMIGPFFSIPVTSRTQTTHLGDSSIFAVTAELM